jgi:hypothetical protein
MPIASNAKPEINEVLNKIEVANWIDGLYEWVCEGRPIDSLRLTGLVRELLGK